MVRRILALLSRRGPPRVPLASQAKPGSLHPLRRARCAISLRGERIAALVLPFALGAGAASCKTTPDPYPTLRVAVSTDLATPGAFDGLAIHVERTSDDPLVQTKTMFDREYSYDSVRALPDSLVLYEDSSLLDDHHYVLPITVRVAALRNGQEVLVRSARLHFRHDQGRLLRMPLCASCLGKTCDEGKTCKQGLCTDVTVDAATLPVDDGSQPLVDPECPEPASICEGRCGEPGCGSCPQDPTVLVTQPGYAIDAHEVTRAAYEGWLAQNPHPPEKNPAAGECPSALSYWPDPDCMARPEVCTGPTCAVHPQVCVPFCAAAAYCRWAGKRLCGAVGGGPVPTVGGPPEQSEWFRACAGPTFLPFPYGDTYQPMACNDASGTTKPVEGSPACNGALPGVYDMVGNVFEWENGCSNGSCRARGGDYASPQTGCSLGTLFNAAQGFPDVGFRCCIDE